MVDDKNRKAGIVLTVILTIMFLIAGVVQFNTGYKEKKNCNEKSTAEITEVRKHSSRGLIDKTVYYEFVVGDTLYKCTDSFSFFVSYPSSQTEIVHYNEDKPSESYLGDTPCGIKNGIKDWVCAIIFGLILLLFIKKKI